MLRKRRKNYGKLKLLKKELEGKVFERVRETENKRESERE